MRTLIVGGGAAGAVIAARLSEDARHEVVLVEAGPDYAGPLPDDLVDGTRNSMLRHDWGYRYRATSRGLGRAIWQPFPRGRVVGGSSAVNTCIALRGQPADYDEWAARGLPEWSWAACLPYFKKLERDLDFGVTRPDLHGDAGPVPIRRHTRDELGPWQAAFLEACAAVGFPACSDTNDPAQTGAGPHAMNKIDGQRMGANRVYLTPEARARRNLRIVADTRVRRVVFSNGRLARIEMERHGRVFDERADRVVLAAGAIATPGILARSGIGPRAAIDRIGVELVRALPVGEQLLDHPGVAIFFAPRHEGTSETTYSLIQNVCRYASKGSSFSNDIQIQPGSFIPLPTSELRGVSLAAVIGKPHGKGALRFASARVDDAPIIELRLLDDERDQAMAREALRHIHALANTKIIKSLARPVYPLLRPFDEAGALRAELSRMTGSGYHPCGSAPMGADDDPQAVVDAHGRVRGVPDLFVCDASVMPTIPTANTHLTTLMMGERFAEWLRED